MTISVLQERMSDATAGATTIVLAFSGAVTVGSVLHVVATGDSAQTISTCSDSVNGSYGAALDTVVDTADNQRMAHFYFKNTGAGTPSVTVTFSASCANRTICIREIGGADTTASVLAHTGQFEVAGVSGTDAITTGTATNASQPALISGVAMNGAGTQSPAAGTGFTSVANGLGWQLGTGINLGRAESKRITTTTAVAATWTNASGSPYIQVMAIFAEAGAGGSIDPGVMFSSNTGVIGPSNFFGMQV